MNIPDRNSLNVTDEKICVQCECNKIEHEIISLVMEVYSLRFFFFAQKSILMQRHLTKIAKDFENNKGGLYLLNTHRKSYTHN